MGQIKADVLDWGFLGHAHRIIGSSCRITADKYTSCASSSISGVHYADYGSGIG